MRLRAPQAVEATAGGSLWIADTGNDRVLLVGDDGVVNAEIGRLRHPVGLAANSTGDQVWVVDADGLHLAGHRTIARVSGARDVAVDEFDDIAYVTLPERGQVAVVHLRSGTVDRFAAVDNPCGVALSPDRQRVYVTAADALHAVSVRARQIDVVARGLGEAEGLSVTPGGVVVADRQGEAVRGVNIRHGSSTNVWATDLSAPRDVAFDRIHKTIVIADTGNDRVLRLARDASAAVPLFAAT